MARLKEKKTARRKRSSLADAQKVAALVDDLCDGRYTSDAAFYLAQVIELAYVQHVRPLLEQSETQGEMAFWPDNVKATRAALFEMRQAEEMTDGDWAKEAARVRREYAEPS